MFLLAFLTVLMSEQITVPAAHWHAIEIGRAAPGTRLECTFDTQRDARVQVMLMSKEQASRFFKGRPARSLEDSGWETHGQLKHHLDGAAYALIIDNRINHRPSNVQIHVVLHTPSSALVYTLPPERQHTIVALSLLFFGSTVALTAYQFLRHQ
jgi:hypothetical protein